MGGGGRERERERERERVVFEICKRTFLSRIQIYIYIKAEYTMQSTFHPQLNKTDPARGF